MNEKIAVGLLAAVFAIPGAAIAADAKDTTKDTPRDTKAAKDAPRDARAAKSSDGKGTDAKGSARNAASEVKETVSDSIITTKIKGEFAKDKAVSAMNIKVDTDQKGMVTLSGNAKTKAEADKAESIAKGTQGVTSVKNNITVGAADTRSEAKPGAKSDMKDSKADTKADAKAAAKK